MKIEMGESLIYSFLRHEKKCLVTQTNWKASGNWNISEDTYDSVKYEFDRLKAHHSFSDIFGNQRLEQVIKQAEIDVLGVSLRSDEQRVYAFEVAFHEAGLNYGSKMETRNRVFKKLLRGYLTLKCYFPNHKYTLAFCSPKVNNATEQYIQEYFDVLNEFQSDYVSFEYYSNEKFYTNIMQKTLDITVSESDSSELFSRAVKLLKLSESFEVNKADALIAPLRTEPEIPIEGIHREINPLNIETVFIRGVEVEIPTAIGRVFQEYIQKAMRKLLNQNLLTEIEIIDLQDEEYCGKKFDLDYPLLKPYNLVPNQRYYRPETFGGYMLCNHWFPNRRDDNQYKLFRQWLLSLANNDNIAA